MTSNHIHTVAIAGGAGQVGGHILKSLIEKKSFKIRVISRDSSEANFPNGVEVVRGDYGDDAFLEKALTGQDALIVTLGFSADNELQAHMIDAAAKTGTRWIVPTEFGSDNAHPQMREDVPVNSPKTRYREQIEKLGKSHWLGIVNGTWYDYSLPGGMYGIDFKNRQATLYDGGVHKFDTTTLPTVGRMVAGLLALPIEAGPGEPSLRSYADQFVYVSSFQVSQRDILDAVQRTTGTSDQNWTIKHRSSQEYIDEGRQRLQQGDFYGIVNILYGYQFKGDVGGNYSATRPLCNGPLNLPTEDLDKVTATIVSA